MNQNDSGSSGVSTQMSTSVDSVRIWSRCLDPVVSDSIDAGIEFLLGTLTQFTAAILARDRGLVFLRRSLSFGVEADGRRKYSIHAIIELLRGMFTE